MEFKVFTLNVWGIPFVSKHKNVRIRAIAGALSTCTYDVVCLQEVWADSDYLLIKENVKGVLPFSHYFYSGVFGSGVCVFSRHPIVDTHFHKWMINGYVHKLHHGDWFGGKGIGMCQILWKGMLLNIYSAHLHAEYNRKHDEYFACRVVQAYDTAQFINFTAGSADVIILAGDLNCEPGDLTYRFMVEMTSLQDAFKVQSNGAKRCTNLDVDNIYTPKSIRNKGVEGPRIDYVLYRGCKNVQVELKEYKQPFPQRIPNTNLCYSDHEAISATLNISKVAKRPRTLLDISLDKPMLLEGIDVMDQGIESVSKHRIFYWIMTMLLLAILIGSIFYEPNFSGVLHTLRIVLALMMCYTFVMATLWNMIEANALFSTKLSMQINVRACDLQNHNSI